MFSCYCSLYLKVSGRTYIYADTWNLKGGIKNLKHNKARLRLLVHIYLQSCINCETKAEGKGVGEIAKKKNASVITAGH